MQKIIDIIAITCLAVFIAEASGIMGWVKFLLYVFFKRPQSKRLKPFDCSMCLAFWISIFYFWNNSPIIIVYAATASVTAIVVESIMRKLR